MGNKLTNHAPGQKHCGSQSTGWLSNWPPEDKPVPASYTGQPGTYPDVEDGIVPRIVCFDGRAAFNEEDHCYASKVANVVQCFDPILPT